MSAVSGGLRRLRGAGRRPEAVQAAAPEHEPPRHGRRARTVAADAALTALLAIALAGLPAVCELSPARAQQKVEISSRDLDAGQPVALPAFWFPPSANAPTPAPAMLLLHGCGGPYGVGGRPSERLREMAGRLQGLGVGALVVDSLTPRGEKELCTQPNGQRRVTQANRLRDALGALDWLAAQPGVDAARIGFMGWSNGGSTVLAATNRQHREVAANVLRPSLAVAWYPGCALELNRSYEATAPLLLLVGAADDWTPAAPCQALATAARGAPVQIESYAGAYHGFDSRAPLRLRTEVPNGVNPGRGVHVGGDAAARAASALRLEAYLREHWNLATP